jgi:hypothetical protein
MGRILTNKFTLFAGPLRGVRVNGRTLIERRATFAGGVLTKTTSSVLEVPVGDFLPPGEWCDSFGGDVTKPLSVLEVSVGDFLPSAKVSTVSGE